MARGQRHSDTELSKALSWLLRHGAVKEGIDIDKEGFVDVASILQNKRFRSYKLEDIIRIVENCQKQRFTLRAHRQDGRQQIKANQGHTIQVQKLDIAPIKDPTQFPVAIHGTKMENWEKIKIQGLSRMSRQHIHMACGEPRDKQVISGMRTSCDVRIYVDMGLAMKDGIQFFLSPNRVILSPGDSDGFIKPKYFSRIVHVKPKQ